MRCPSSLHLARYLEQALSRRRQRQVTHHLARCAPCQAELAALRRTGELLAELELAPAPARLWEGVRARHHRTAPRRWLLAAATAGALLLLLARPKPPLDQAVPDHHRLSACLPLGSAALGEVLASAGSRR